MLTVAAAAAACLVAAMYAAASSTEQNDVAACWRVPALSEEHVASGCTSICSTPDHAAAVGAVTFATTAER